MTFFMCYSDSRYDDNKSIESQSMVPSPPVCMILISHDNHVMFTLTLGVFVDDILTCQ